MFTLRNMKQTKYTHVFFLWETGLWETQSNWPLDPRNQSSKVNFFNKLEKTFVCTPGVGGSPYTHTFVSIH